jgi:ribonuclease VapC
VVVDTSAIIAILNNEGDAVEFEERLYAGPIRRISTASYVEASMVVAGVLIEPDFSKLDWLLRSLGFEIMVVTQEDVLLARAAFLRYGKGRHPAKLNFGDCFSYALAMRMNEPLLFKGNDFSQTDVRQA